MARHTPIGKSVFVISLLTAGFCLGIPVSNSNQDATTAPPPNCSRLSCTQEHNEDTFRQLTVMLYTNVEKIMTRGQRTPQRLREALAAIENATPLPLSRYACTENLHGACSNRSAGSSSRTSMFNQEHAGASVYKADPLSWIHKLGEEKGNSLDACEWAFLTPRCTRRPRLFSPIICEANCATRKAECKCGSVCQPRRHLQLPVLKLKCVSGKPVWSLAWIRHVPPEHGACACIERDD